MPTTVANAWEEMLLGNSPTLTGLDPDQLAQELGIDHDDLSKFVADNLEELLNALEDEDDETEVSPINPACFVPLSISDDTMTELGGADSPVNDMFRVLVAWKFGFLAGVYYLKKNVSELTDIAQTGD